MYETKLQKVEYQSEPNRCKAIIPQGQCQYHAIENSDYCQMHGGAPAQHANNRVAVRNYNFTRYRARIEQFAESEGIKSLREEIGVVRLLLEDIVNRCQDGDDLLMYSSKIRDLALTIEKLVVSCHKLESSLAYTLDRGTVLNLATNIVNSISIHITDQITLDKIVSDITRVIEAA